MKNLLDWVGLVSFPLIWLACIFGAGWSGVMFGWLPALIVAAMMLHIADRLRF